MTVSLLSSSPSPTGVKSSGGALRQFSLPAMGARCSVQFACEIPWQAAGFERAAGAWLTAFETKYSRHQPDSVISRINRAAGRDWVEIDDELEQLLKLCDALHIMARGVLDPTALPLARLWNYEVEVPAIPDPAEMARVRRLVGWSKVKREPGRIFLPLEGMELDFDGFAKEYAVDMVAQLAVIHGIPNVLVDFGSGLRALGQPPGRPGWHVGLETAPPPGPTADGIEISGKGVATSGDHLHSFVINGRRHGHIINPRTGWPVANDCRQATVIADTCLQAAVMATTTLLLGVNEGISYLHGFPGVEGLLVTESASASTRGFLKSVAAA